MVKKLLIKDEKEMTALGKFIGQHLVGGEIIELIGPLGAGKTTLAKAILSGTGLKGGSSPTFILDAVYKIKSRKKFKTIHHLDLYRLKNQTELITLGVYDLMGKADIVMLIEWADRFPTPANKGKIKIEIKPSNAQERNIKIESNNENHDRLVAGFNTGFNG